MKRKLMRTAAALVFAVVVGILIMNLAVKAFNNHDTGVLVGLLLCFLAGGCIRLTLGDWIDG